MHCPTSSREGCTIIRMSTVKHHAANAIEEAVYSHTVAIIPNEAPGVGSGVAVSWGDERIILTAAHVLSDIPQDQLRFFVRADGSLQRRGPDDPHRPTTTEIGCHCARTVPPTTTQNQLISAKIENW